MYYEHCNFSSAYLKTNTTDHTSLENIVKLEDTTLPSSPSVVLRLYIIKRRKNVKHSRTCWLMLINIGTTRSFQQPNWPVYQIDHILSPLWYKCEVSVASMSVVMARWGFGVWGYPSSVVRYYQFSMTCAVWTENRVDLSLEASGSPYV